MIRQLFESVKEADIFGVISICISAAILILICMPVHECAHAFAANKLGDPTARNQGRLTLNPFRHIDPLGCAMMLIVGVGYAKPVPVNMFYFKNKKRDMALTAIAGPLSNILMAIIFAFLYVLTLFLTTKVALTSTVAYNIFKYAILVFYYAAYINISLGIFNLIPVPPFDGSRILGFFLPDRIYYKIMQYEQIIFWCVLILLMGGFLSGPLSNVIDGAFDGIVNIFALMFGMI